MASYQEWNQALAKYFLNGVPLGTKIYLSVDRDTLELIGQSSFSFLTATNWSEDFRSAVVKQVIFDDEVNLENIKGIDNNSPPRCVAFLAATVLAAYQMADEEKISEINYFERLREIFGLLGNGHGRPLGMKPGSEAEEPLWKIWNNWLWEQGYVPSAKQGNGLRQKFINYPISQCLLRQADKDWLWEFFTNKQWKTSWEAQTLFTKIRCEKKNLPNHLKDLVTNNRQRFEAVAEAIHEVYQQWLITGDCSSVKQHREKRNWNTNLFAGIYRTEHPFLGQVEYYIYPKQQRGRQLDIVEVQSQNAKEKLREDRPGWYLPLQDTLSVKDLDEGIRYSILSLSQIEQLVLPARDFWILIPDPENPDSGVYASWGTPELGTKFILLCKQELLPDIERLRGECLLEWDGELQTVDKQSTWVELHQCMVISQAWDAVLAVNQELKDALQPIVRLSISFSGGLRVPNQRGWLEGYPPQITIFGFAPKAEIEVTRLIDGEVILTRSQKTNQAEPLELNKPGSYLVRATYSTEVAERVINILNFDRFKIAGLEPKHQKWLSINDEYSLCGSVIKQFPSKLKLRIKS